MSKRSVPRCPTILIILDGFGVNPSKKNNAVYEANTPNLDRYFGTYPHTTLSASGKSVGLPRGQMGNSEVGHFTIGCGDIYMQELARINATIENGIFYEKIALQNALETAKVNKRPIHLVGLLSNGGVHSHTSHLYAILKMAKDHGVKPVIHVITDGRDTPPRSARQYMETLQQKLDEYGGEVATIVGRFYAMDRDNRWERTKIAWDAMVHGKGQKTDSMFSALETAYADQQTDEFILPQVVEGVELIKADDQLIFFNFRSDRPRQLAEALGREHFDGFERGDFEEIVVTCLTEYDKSLLAPVVFTPERPSTNLSHIISLAGYHQLHTAETEKYAHVTFFFNGGREKPYAGEDRVMIDSPCVNTYDEMPEMSAKEVADTVVNGIKKKKYSFILVNFANGDMVGHSAVPEAIVKAVEAMDKEVGRVLDAAREHQYSVVLTSDHGNCDEYVNPLTGEPHTQHTVYPVPLLVVDQSNWQLDSCGGLANVAPTILELMGLRQPHTMTSDSLLLKETKRNKM